MPSIAQRFIAAFGSFPLDDDHGLAAMQWMHDFDPHGTGALLEDFVIFNFTDNSKVLLDLKSRSFHAQQ